ncbi:membrane protein [Streptomyces subrutilus]|uniref:DUF3093 domain-containing protein n=1 Tax=Streptomyces subrutilus TaxID=36818 RepID=A0A5P2UGG7_9ACTN|nr:DUF3093 domain-containing protein [Streptomyces subrutilus]QEU78353.1 DUF3093 domain-containing protein [Streptomyces subrutilus]GGZ60418.1 membrane protein [Streptomyces subrutilus]
MQPSPAHHDERLTAPRTWWGMAVLIGLACALMLLPLGTLPLLAGLVGGTALAGLLVSSYGSARVRVVNGALAAGEARIPVAALGEPEVLDPEESRAWRTYKADTRAFMLMRSYVPTAVRVAVTDPQDPTPYVYVSTREPEALASAIRAAKG